MSEPAASLVERQLGHFETVHPVYVAGVRSALAEQEKKAKGGKKKR